MSAGRYSFLVEQGSTLSFEIQYKDINGNPFDLTHYSGKMQIRPAVADDTTTVICTLSSSLDNDGTGLNFSGSNGTTPPTSGSIGLYISAASSSAMSFGEAIYDLDLTSGSYTTRILEGKVQLNKAVTR